MRVLTVVIVVACRRACGKSASASFFRYASREISSKRQILFILEGGEVRRMYDAKDGYLTLLCGLPSVAALRRRDEDCCI